MTELRPSEEASDEIYGVLFPDALTPGFVVGPETIRRARQADEEWRRKQAERKNKPPKPPKPNARIGGIALGDA